MNILFPNVINVYVLKWNHTINRQENISTDLKVKIEYHWIYKREKYSFWFPCNHGEYV